MYKFINLLNTTKLNDLNNLSIFFINAFKLRENSVITSVTFFPLNVALGRIFHLVNLLK